MGEGGGPGTSVRNARGPKRSFVHSLFVCRHGRDMDMFSHRGFVNSHWEPAIEDEATKKKRPTPFIGISLFRLYLNAGTRESPDRDTREFELGIRRIDILGIGLFDCFGLLFLVRNLQK